jgi:fermentation-respiration switch protein FrsA (DUF1100 family)
MKRPKRSILIGAAGAIILIVAWLLLFTRGQAHELLTQEVGRHSVPDVTPAAYGLSYEDVVIVSSDEIELVGWYIPSQNGAAIMAQHGYKNNRAELLAEAAMLADHGYGVLLTTVRAHDYSDGERISFGTREMDDLDAWYRYLLTRPDVDAERIAVLGNSYGGALAIQYAAQNPAIKAVVAHSAFSSLDDTVSTSVSFFSDLPPFPFAPLIVFWAEREAGFTAADIDTTRWVAAISPRPILLLQGGSDIVISPESGERLYAAAGEPKELWYEPDLGHVMFDGARPGEFESRVTAFYDRYLLAPLAAP